ncbi:hypothetical protein PGTUg99_004885 [Puccinia graminis f. sp. tritici]|uniref:Uncharacterized protein n=1 Tax=Puccinia graminis f. sp. tritici TaxID=56615 RepID=A0A5B0R4I1_PUCGR|nr:hypothetical protein PGTUg99_004885 [Puccinia graminis f. sp. tritici]
MAPPTSPRSRFLQEYCSKLRVFHGDYNELAFDNLHNTPFASLSTLLKSFNTDLPILEAHVTKDAANDALELSLEAIEGKSPARSQIEVPACLISGPEVDKTPDGPTTNQQNIKISQAEGSTKAAKRSSR